MAETFGIVLFAVVAVAALVAVVTLVTSGRGYDQIGRGGLSLRDGADHPGDDRADGAAGAAAAAREREDDIRQMLEARNELRRRHGRQPVDVEAELRALDRAAADPELEAEIRAHVVARSERLERQGSEPLDVDAEVARRLRGLGGGADA
jgi:hypothetical protein